MSIVRSLTLVVSLAAALVFGAPLAHADATHGTKEEAKALCEKAVAEIKANGNEKAFAKFVTKDGGFQDRDLYVFVLDDKGTFLSHGTKPALIGKSGLPLTDPNGFKLVEEFLKVKETGWVDYMWPDVTDNNKVKPKSSYIIHDGSLFVGVG